MKIATNYSANQNNISFTRTKREKAEHANAGWFGEYVRFWWNRNENPEIANQALRNVDRYARYLAALIAVGGLSALLICSMLNSSSGPKSV